MEKESEYLKEAWWQERVSTIIPVHPENLPEEAWRVLGELVQTGMAVLSDGSIIKPGDDGFGALVQVLKFVAQFKGKEKEKSPELEGFAPQVTFQSKKEMVSG